MSRRPAAITQADVIRVLKGAFAAGMSKERLVDIKLSPDGTVNILFGDRSAEDRATISQNEWDEVLK